ncbi:Serine/threonine-protein kinase, partial [Phytophthora idaei]
MENYHILERIGEGSFGKVYRGRRKYSGHIVALKFVTKQGKSARDLENLRQEINILRRLNHCNIIAMMDSFETDGEFCMVTEYAQGELFQVLEDEHSLPEEEIKKIAIQLIQALHVLHSNRIIHRDMKPQNILIGSRQQIKLCDFGFARAIAHDTSLLRSIKGTPLYMAPELVQEKPYNYTVDLWSLGVILYELAVGKPPFYTDRIVSLIQMIVRDDVEYPSTMSADFQSFLKGLLNKDPAQRLKWPKILDHPFIQETPEQLETRLQLERQVRTLPRFFKEKEPHQPPGGGNEEKVKPSVERLRSCDEWKICDPETGRKLSKPELPHENTTKMKPLTRPADESNNREPSPPPEPARPVHSVVLESFLAVWDRISREMDVKHVDTELLRA